jgi:peptide-methionine (S)-S-oxide reductase
MEAVFERIEGIASVAAGYSGGGREHPTYEQVCTGLTGHAEVVKVDFDPAKIGYGEVLDIFFSAHDPTTEDRQGADTGTQYRSIILYADDSQRLAAIDKIAEIDKSGIHRNRVVTELSPLARFWRAEDEHQNYYEKHPYAGYCRVVIAPKLQKIGLTADALNRATD